MFDEMKVRGALRRAWSAESASQWSAENPANGQCNVTAAVIHDLFGGEVLRTPVPGFWHYYNRIDGHRYDLSDSQFTDPGARFEMPEYQDDLSSAAAAMDGIPAREYTALMIAFKREISRWAT